MFATVNPTDYQKNELSNICPCISLNQATHFEDLLSMLQGDEIVVLDNYFFTTDYQRAIKAKGCKLVCIDDMHDKHYVADVVINHAEGITEKQLSVEPYTKIFLGFSYALLRKKYIELENKDRHIDNLNKVFVCLGGADADTNNLSLKIIKACVSLNYFKNIDLVVGAGYEYENEMWNYCSDKSFICIHKTQSQQVFAYRVSSLWV